MDLKPNLRDKNFTAFPHHHHRHSSKDGASLTRHVYVLRLIDRAIWASYQPAALPHWPSITICSPLWGRSGGLKIIKTPRVEKNWEDIWLFLMKKKNVSYPVILFEGGRESSLCLVSRQNGRLRKDTWSVLQSGPSMRETSNESD
jgi:hypothetical protein